MRMIDELMEAEFGRICGRRAGSGRGRVDGRSSSVDEGTGESSRMGGARTVPCRVLSQTGRWTRESVWTESDGNLGTLYCGTKWRISREEFGSTMDE